MLTDMQLRALKPAEKIYKVADQQGLYAAVMPSGAVSFRYDYRVNSRRETLIIGRYDPSLSARKPRKPEELGFGMAISLLEARLLRNHAYGAIQRGHSPSRAKVEKRVEAAEALTFGNGQRNTLRRRPLRIPHVRCVNRCMSAISRPNLVG